MTERPEDPLDQQRLELDDLSLNRKQMEGDDRVSLWQILEQLRTGEMDLAPHQREQVWPLAKMARFIHRVLHGLPLDGCISTYQIIGRWGTVLLNDGRQRIGSALRLLQRPEEYGVTKLQAEKALRASRIVQQHRHMENEMEAVERYQFMNAGTALTAYEFYHPWLVVCKCDGIVDLLTEYHQRMRMVLDPLCKGVTKHDQRHNWKRSDLALLLRWITRDSKLNMGNGYTIRHADESADKTVEAVLAREAERIGLSRIAAGVDQVVTFTAMRSEEWRQILLKEEGLIVDGEKVSETTVRFVLEATMYAKHIHDASVPVMSRFMRQMALALVPPHGAEVYGTDEKGRPASKALNSNAGLSFFSVVCDLIGSDLYARSHKRPSRKKQMRLGLDASHPPGQPFATHGDGPTTPEPAHLNRSRGMDADAET